MKTIQCDSCGKHESEHTGRFDGLPYIIEGIDRIYLHFQVTTIMGNPADLCDACKLRAIKNIATYLEGK